MVGITATQKALLSIASIVTDVLAIVKNGVGITDIPRIVSLMKELKSLATEFHDVFPELKDLDAQESTVLMKQTYDLVQKIMSSIA